MKPLICALLLTGACASAEIETWIGQNTPFDAIRTINVSSNEIFLLEGAVETVANGGSIVTFSKANTNSITNVIQINVANYYPMPITLAGPMTVKMQSSSGCMFTYEVREKNPANITPSTAVVIPTDATGPVQVLFESSADLVNWNSALPGTYSANTTNRFFRTRIVRQ